VPGILLFFALFGQGRPRQQATEGDTLDQTRSVLIVDRSEETHEVLQTALNRRGVQTFTAKHASEGVELDRRHHPDVIILDLDVDDLNLERNTPSFWEDWGDNNTPIILLGNLRRNQPRIPGCEFVPKPYHYGPLIRRIEELLD
jgi:DNA-binding response OmpR family regulator